MIGPAVIGGPLIRIGVEAAINECSQYCAGNSGVIPAVRLKTRLRNLCWISRDVERRRQTPTSSNGPLTRFACDKRWAGIGWLCFGLG